MPEISVNELLADQQKQIHLEREILDRCRAGNMVVRMVHERASASSESAMLKTAELDRRFALLVSRLTSGQPKNCYQGDRLLTVLTRVDQAEAFANEILAADVGANIDALAERLAKLLEDMGFNVAAFLERQRNGNVGN